MSNDVDELRSLNLEIGVAESEGRVDFFEQLLAIGFVMRRAKGQVVGREEFVATTSASSSGPTPRPRGA